MAKQIKNTTKEIIKLIESGKHTQTEIAEMGYSFGTVRYWYQKINQPKKFERFMNKHKKRQKKRYAESKKLSTETG